MVNHLIYLFLLLPIFLFSGEFQAKVSRNEVGLGESFTLTLTLIGASAKTSPSVESLSKLFSIHSQHQSSNTVFNNGKLSSSITWKFVLTSQHPGENLITPFTLETSEGVLSTQPITIGVVKTSSSNASNPHGSGIAASVELSKANPYKNEPVLLTLRLISKQNLANVQVQKFELEGAIVEQAGAPIIYDKIDNGIPLGVIEFSYLITPLQTGRLLIPPLVIQGGIPQKRKLSGGSFFDDDFDPFSLLQGFESLKPFASSTEEVMLNVQLPIGEMNPWLPAQSLKIQEHWDDSQHFQEGEAFTRSFTIEAEGLHSSQLPSLEELQVKGGAFKVYADKPELKDEIKNGKLMSYRKEQYTFIPEKSGDLRLPEITVAWWDVANHQKMASTIPSRVINIVPEMRVASNLQKLSIESNEHQLEPVASGLVENPFLYSIIAALALLLAGAILWLVLLQRKMAGLLEKPQKKKEEPVLAMSIAPKKRVNATASKKREGLDDLNPT